jgi:penicillin amidase
MKWLRRAGALLLALMLVAVTALWLYATRATPVVDGTLRMPGLRASLTIERDAHGIPTVRAASARDAAFGVGVVHAQDRLWQLETHRRIGAGRLAEAFGPAALDTDRFLRALAVHRAAAAQWERADAATKEALTAYAEGVNAVLRDHLRARPPEFVILGLQPEDWGPVDSLAWAIMMAWDLGGNWSMELLRMQLALRLPLERVNQVLPPYPGDAPLVTADYTTLFRELKVDATLGRQALRAAPESGVEGVGSNNWVVAGSRSATGMPLLANDPHLKLSAPALWYFVRVEAPGLKVAGATMPGLPFVVLGQNEDIAWGFTNTGPDVQDLYLERIQPGDPTRYQTPEGWAHFETRDEVIRVKGQADVRITVRSTRHGPVISDAGGPTRGLTGPADRPSYALALRWTALDPDPGTVAAGQAFQTARSVDEFIAASAPYVAPMQNMVVADRAGRIGMVSAGKVPVRGPDHDLKGLVPAPGWEAKYDWVGFVPAEQTPRETDPARGWIASANQRIHGPDYPYYLTSQWAAPYRMQRIRDLLEARPRHDLASLRAIQGDQKSLGSLHLLPALQQARSAHPLAARVRARLAAFDGTVAADRPEPLVFWAWSRHLTELVFADDLGAPLFARVFGERSPVGAGLRDALEGVFDRDDTSWCDDQRTPQRETCADMAGLALTRALDELQSAHGSDPDAWRWGAVHQARSEHRPFSRVKALSWLFELRTPVGGDTYTVNVARVALQPDAATGERYLSEHGPSLRALYDLGDPAQSRVMHSTGQSGLPWSPLYRSFVAPWMRVEDVPLWASGPPIHTLTLQP